MSILDDLKSENYRIGDFQAIRYTCGQPPFQEGFLSALYFALGAGRRTEFRRENLQMLFCGMTNLSHDAIVAYLSQQKLIVLGKWEGETFRTAGVCWPNIIVGVKEKSAFGAYGFLRWTWGTEDQDILSWIGIAALFCEFDLIQMFGQRYANNHLTARFMSKFGFRDLATIPRLMLRGDKLESAVVSTLSREDFEDLLSRQIVDSTL
jgi:hypothetical protein